MFQATKLAQGALQKKVRRHPGSVLAANGSIERHTRKWHPSPPPPLAVTLAIPLAVALAIPLEVKPNDPQPVPAISFEYPY